MSAFLNHDAESELLLTAAVCVRFERFSSAPLLFSRYSHQIKILFWHVMGPLSQLFLIQNRIGLALVTMQSSLPISSTAILLLQLLLYLHPPYFPIILLVLIIIIIIIIIILFCNRKCCICEAAGFHAGPDLL